ncbi:TPA: recombination protein NinG [Yersinia enterocolitica]|nr:recombination protein NinG [Yersinia enterocolitica]
MAKLPKHRNCKVCKTRFKPATQYEWWCNEEHREEYIHQLALKARQNTIQKAEQRRREETQAERRSIKIRKLAVKPLSYFAKQAQQAFNEYIRTRDAGDACVSCGRFHGGQYHAGHYLTVGANPELRFNEDNCHRQCAPCNSHLSGNIEKYTPNLIAKIGQVRFDILMGPHEMTNYRRDDYIRIRDEYREKTRALKKLQEAA